jgi:hypothetical protein
MVGNVGKENELPNWLDSFASGQGDIDLYFTSIFFVMTTITTIGYGDTRAVNNYERAFCCCLFMIGVSGTSFIIGSIGSFLSAADTKEA